MKSSPVVLITGASSGIGEQTAHLLGAAGYRLVLAARRIELLNEIAAQIRGAGGEALAVQLDLTHSDQISQLVKVAQDHYGQIDILVNNAGSARHLWFDEQSLGADIQEQLQVNLVGMIQLTRLVLPGMLAEGKGQIIHVSSVAAWVGVPTYTIYNAGKFGARGFLASLRRELRGKGVVVSEIFPGAVDTEFAQDPNVNWKTSSVTPSFALVSSQAVARRILKLIQHRKRKAVIPWFMGLVIWVDTHFPCLVNWILSFYFYTRDGIRYSWQQRSGK